MTWRVDWPLNLIAFFALLLFVPAGNCDDTKRGKQRVDALGDPLPEGAVARLGTVRLQPGGTVSLLAFSPDGRKLACWSTSGLTIFDTATGRELRQVEIRDVGAVTMNWSDNGKGIVVLRIDPDNYYVWDFVDANAARPPVTKPGPGIRMVKAGDDMESLSRFEISPDGKWLAVGRYGRQNRARPIDVYEVVTGRTIRESVKKKTLGPQMGNCAQLLFSGDGKHLFAFSQEKPDAKDMLVVDWDIATGGELRRFVVPLAVPYANARTAALSPDQRLLAVGPADGTVRLHDLRGEQLPRTIGTHIGATPTAKGVTAMVFSPDGNTLVTTGHDKMRRQWDVATGKEKREFSGTLSGVMATVTFSPDGKRIAVADSGSGVIHLLDATTGADSLRFPGHRSGIWTTSVSPNGKSVITTGYDKTLRLWDTTTGRELRRLKTKGWPTAIFTPDNQILVRADNSLKLLDASTLTPMDLPSQMKGIPDVAFSFSVDGRVLITGNKAVISLWEWPNGRLIRRINLPAKVAPNEEVYCSTLSLSPDGSLLATTSQRRVGRGGIAPLSTYVWSVATGRQLLEFPVFPPYPRHSFTADGRHLIVGGSIYTYGERDREKLSGALALWDPFTGKLRRTFVFPDNQKFDRRIRNVVLSPDGWTVAVGEESAGVVFLYEVATGQIRRRLIGHREGLSSMAYTPDGHRLVTSSYDNTALVWDLSLADAVVTPPSPPPLQQLWETIGVEQADRAYAAMAQLALVPDSAVTMLAARLQPAVSLDADIDRLIADLDNVKFAVRVKAAMELDKLGDAAIDGVRAASAKPHSPEVRRRLATFLERHDRDRFVPDRVRQLRAIEVLEMIGSQKARNLLDRLARGAKSAPLTQTAAAVLRRLEREIE